MTRFARAKGSKASNEKVPEPPTSWSEMKQELLNKNKELEEKKNHEKAMQRRQANYQAFLQEKEEEDTKNVSWADFPETQNSRKKPTTPSTAQKCKFKFDNNDSTKVKSLEPLFKNKKVNEVENIGEDSDVEFSALKLQIDKVLDSQKSNDSDSDAPPEVASIREKPQEIIVTKAKKPNQRLQILIKQNNKSDRDRVIKGLPGKAAEGDVKKIKPQIENLSDKDKKKIEKKQERYIKQLEKKKLKRQEKKSENAKTENTNKTNNNDDSETNSDINSFIVKQENQNLSEIEAKRQVKKLERRKKQKEKKLKQKQDAGLISSLENKRKDEVLTEKDLANIQKKKERRARQVEKRKAFREAKELAAQNAEASQEHNEEVVTSAYDGNNTFQNNNSNINGETKFQENVNEDERKTNSIEKKPDQNHLINQKKRKLKIKDNKDIQRKKLKSEVMFLNGKTIEIDYIDGFPVKKEDADRLKKLRREMISKGLPRSEINVSLKLERRRAEKALTRERKNVCFNCRKSGHNLSECPELNNDQVVQTSCTGICFKCGSTEHTHFECKVVKGLDYKFAQCFICKEQGHISRQCPDNQRGLYPKGGACKVCGDVTHMKKDCPKYQCQQAQLQDSLSVETMDNRNPDDLGVEGDFKNNLGSAKKLNKIRF